MPLNAATLRRALYKMGLVNAAGAPVGGSSLIHQATVTLTDAQIKALPTTPILIVPFTEELGYVGSPTRLPWPTEAFVFSDTRAGLYTNLTVETPSTQGLILAWGSDFSTGISKLNAQEKVVDFGFARLVFRRFSSSLNSFADTLPTPAEGVQHGHTVDSQWLLGPGGLQDNAIVISMYNADGDLLGGNAANSLRVSLAFVMFDIATGRMLTTTETGWDEVTRTFVS